VSARADARRFAIIIGNNVGHADDARLAYAESDAEKVHSVLRELGGFHPADMLLLRGEDARSVRQSLVAMNDRIRNAAPAKAESLLFVYYSGHADAAALRLGDERVEISELTQLVRGSAATFRLMVVDACRSAALTRRKGGRIVEPFPVPFRSSLPGEGLAFLWASAVSEDAQESDALRGSFFTHAFVSGLLGAADSDGDGAVVLEEAYRYSYDATLRATSRTAYGIQHPGFEYDYRGHGMLVLTQPGAVSGRRGTLRLPPNIAFLVMRDHPDGAVVAELSVKDPARALSLRAGTYFLRGRASDVLFEGPVTLAGAQTLDVVETSLERVEYARLVRKGGAGPAWAHALDLGPAVQSYAPGQGAWCWGATLGYMLEFERFTLGARLATCRMQSRNDLVRARTDEYDASLAGLYTWDFQRLSFASGIAAGAAIAHQRFETTGLAPSRTSTSPYMGVVADLTLDLSGPMFVRLDLRATTQLVHREVPQLEDTELDVMLALRGALLMGFYLGSAR
jgi:hypothetical protein